MDCLLSFPQYLNRIIEANNIFHSTINLLPSREEAILMYCCYLLNSFNVSSTEIDFNDVIAISDMFISLIREEYDIPKILTKIQKYITDEWIDNNNNKVMELLEIVRLPIMNYIEKVSNDEGFYRYNYIYKYDKKMLPLLFDKYINYYSELINDLINNNSDESCS